MPNHITNILVIKGDQSLIDKMLRDIKLDNEKTGSIDFNKIIPMPDSLNITESSDTDRGLKIYKEFISEYLFEARVTNITFPIDKELVG